MPGRCRGGAPELDGCYHARAQRGRRAVLRTEAIEWQQSGNKAEACGEALLVRVALGVLQDAEVGLAVTEDASYERLAVREVPGWTSPFADA